MPIRIYLSISVDDNRLNYIYHLHKKNEIFQKRKSKIMM